MDDDVLESWEDAAETGELEKRMEQREKELFGQQNFQNQLNVASCPGIIPQEEMGKTDYVPQIKILKRENGMAVQKPQPKAVKPIKTLAEKEADYAAARARILGDYSNVTAEEDSKKIILSSDAELKNTNSSNDKLRR